MRFSDLLSYHSNKSDTNKPLTELWDNLTNISKLLLGTVDSVDSSSQKDTIAKGRTL